jgi:hypothetical protein
MIKLLIVLAISQNFQGIVTEIKLDTTFARKVEIYNNPNHSRGVYEYVKPLVEFIDDAPHKYPLELLTVGDLVEVYDTLGRHGIKVYRSLDETLAWAVEDSIENYTLDNNLENIIKNLGHPQWEDREVAVKATLDLPRRTAILVATRATHHRDPEIRLRGQFILDCIFNTVRNFPLKVEIIDE